MITEILIPRKSLASICHFTVSERVYAKKKIQSLSIRNNLCVLWGLEHINEFFSDFLRQLLSHVFQDTFINFSFIKFWSCFWPNPFFEFKRIFVPTCILFKLRGIITGRGIVLCYSQDQIKKFSVSTTICCMVFNGIFNVFSYFSPDDSFFFHFSADNGWFYLFPDNY